MIDLISLLIARIKERNNSSILDLDSPNVRDIVKSAINDFVNESDRLFYAEIRLIADKIEKAKQEMAETVYDGSVGDAELELDSVIQSTEKAANDIMDAAESILGLSSTLDDAQLASRLKEYGTKLFEACNFQDITGQRATKVLKILKDIENTVNAIMESLSLRDGDGGSIMKKATSPAKEKLINGPKLEGEAPTQEDIDKIFENE